MPADFPPAPALRPCRLPAVPGEPGGRGAARTSIWKFPEKVVWIVETEKKKVMLSGIQPSGDLTLGSYLGAIKNWV